MDKHESIQQILSVNGYYYIDLIGSGSFADVYLCHNQTRAKEKISPIRN